MRHRGPTAIGRQPVVSCLGGLDAFCKDLKRKGVKFDQMPKDMPWGWKHAYLRDPDGHQISLYWAGRARLDRTVMRDGGH